LVTRELVDQHCLHQIALGVLVAIVAREEQQLGFGNLCCFQLGDVRARLRDIADDCSSRLDSSVLSQVT